MEDGVVDGAMGAAVEVLTRSMADGAQRGGGMVDCAGCDSGRGV